MTLRGFKYLHRNRLLTLTAILILTSMLFSVTAFSFLGMYNGFSNYAGEADDIAAIYGTQGSTPLTGIIPVYLADELGAINGVQATSPEIIAPCVINDQSVFVRGVVPQEVEKLNPLNIKQGVTLSLSDLDAALIGINLAQRLNLKVNDTITVFGTLAQQYVTLYVQGVFSSNSPLDDEAIVPLYCGQWLRGLTYNQASLIRVKMDTTQVNLNTLYQTIAKEATQPTTQPNATKTETQKELEALIPLVKIKFSLQTIGIQESQDFMKNYLNRYGVSKDTLIALSVAVFAFASGTAACALTLFLNQHKHETTVLRSIGTSKRTLKLDLIAKTLPWAIAASVIGSVLGSVVLLFIQNLGYLQVLSHRIIFPVDPLIIAANIALITVLVIIGIVRSKVEP